MLNNYCEKYFGYIIYFLNPEVFLRVYCIKRIWFQLCLKVWNLEPKFVFVLLSIDKEFWEKNLLEQSKTIIMVKHLSNQQTNIWGRSCIIVTKIYNEKSKKFPTCQFTVIFYFHFLFFPLHLQVIFSDFCGSLMGLIFLL